ncbi:MAG TPA: glycoside hydrolase family 15 protein [Solirubrobacteraceae bacterium]|nr:glycoside hydrolase family 15 protein [Solirubrobacteraceae bacterium]
MALKLEEYALIGDTQAAALVGRDGSIDWLCLPRFDSGACFASLLGDERNGRWRLAPPPQDVRAITRRYRPGTLVLETEFITATGAVRVTDCMPVRGAAPDLVRVVEGLRGRVELELELVLRFDYGRSIPWLRHDRDGIVAIAGPDAVRLISSVPTVGRDMRTCARFTLGNGDRETFVLTWHPSHEPPPAPVDPLAAVELTADWWREWSSSTDVSSRRGDAVQRSLITLKALTYAPTGGIVAAPTTSLPEQLGGERNWDYRFCWLRDATLTLLVLLDAGKLEEARAWRDWLLRAVAGRPADMQIMYGVAGERRLTEVQLDWLSGYEDSLPVRIGNAAARQFQIDVFGEVMDALLHAREAGLDPDDAAWELQLSLLEHLEHVWVEPDEGIWEMRGPRRHFVHSKVMAWVAFDRAIKTVERTDLDGPVQRWRDTRRRIHDEVCERGFDRVRGTFTQSYDSPVLDAATLLIAVVGFLPPDDPRVHGTIEAVRHELVEDGLVLRYRTDQAADGLSPGEGAFLPCSFWLVDALAVTGRRDEAVELFERLLELCNDVGLLSEEYDPAAGRLVGNFPQAFSHVGLVSSAMLLDDTAASPAVERATTRRDAQAAADTP